MSPIQIPVMIQVLVLWLTCSTGGPRRCPQMLLWSRRAVGTAVAQGDLPATKVAHDPTHCALRNRHGPRDWAWRTMTAWGEAWRANKSGLRTYEVTLEVLEPGYKQTLVDITSVGWRLHDQFEHPRVKVTDVTPKSDGGHEVVRTESQKTTFYFVRDETHPTPPVEQAESSARWPEGWYQTEHGWRWWDGAQWTQPHVGHPQEPYSQLSYGTAMAGMSNGEHVLHLLLTLFTCGLWAPAWILLARKRRSTRPY